MDFVEGPQFRPLRHGCGNMDLPDGPETRMLQCILRHGSCRGPVDKDAET